MNQKEKIRQKFLKTRNGLPELIRQKKSRVIQKKLELFLDFESAKSVLFYYPFKTEVDVLDLLMRHHKTKKIYLPCVKKERIEPALFHGHDYLRPGYAGIPEPIETPGKKSTHQDQEGIELMLIPGLAFDRHGTRLGYGKGFYDRYLKRHKHCLKIGVAFEEQMVDYIPRDKYDIPVDLVITDKMMYRFDTHR